jgi:hypothetical protein
MTCHQNPGPAYYCQDSCGIVGVGRAVYNFCSPSPAQSFSGPSPAGIMTTFYSQIRDSLNPEGQVPVFISPRNKVAGGGTGFPFLRLL